MVVFVPICSIARKLEEVILKCVRESLDKSFGILFRSRLDETCMRAVSRNCVKIGKILC